MLDRPRLPLPNFRLRFPKGLTVVSTIGPKTKQDNRSFQNMQQTRFQIPIHVLLAAEPSEETWSCGTVASRAERNHGAADDAPLGARRAKVKGVKGVSKTPPQSLQEPIEFEGSP